MLLEDGVCSGQCILLAKLISLCPASFCTPRPNFPVNSRYLLTSYFCIPDRMLKIIQMLALPNKLGFASSEHLPTWQNPFIQASSELGHLYDPTLMHSHLPQGRILCPSLCVPIQLCLICLAPLYPSLQPKHPIECPIWIEYSV